MSGTASTPRTPALVGAEGGTATVDVAAIPTTLNPHSAAGADAATKLAAVAVWPQVFTVAPKVAPRLNTDLVRSAEVVSVAPQTVIYQIDPRAAWSDGVPISADDFIYAWAMQRGGAVDVDGSPASVASTVGYHDIATVTGTNGGKTVTVVFQNPFADWPSLFADLLPAHVARKVGWNHGFDRFDPATFVSGGPWAVSTWTPGAALVLARNPHWWGEATHLDRVVVVPTASAGAVAGDLSAGRAQLAAPAGYDAGFLAAVSSSPQLSSQSALGTTMLQLEFNVRHAPLSAAAVRQGIGRSIDRPGIVSAVAQPLDPMVGIDNDHLLANVQSGYGDNAAGFHTVDRDTATELFVQGGLAADPHGTWTLRGAPVQLQFTWASDDPWSAAVGPMIAGELVSAGFDVASTPVPGDLLAGSVLPAGAFDLALAPVESGAYPTAMSAYFSTLGASGSGTSRDWSGFDDPKVDALFTQAARELAGQSARALYQQIDQELWQELPTLPLFAEPNVLVSSVSMLGEDPNPGGAGVLWDAALWFFLVPAPPKGTTAHALGGEVAIGAR
jgi:peptide/nickel transport system substrate-binding protein